MELSTCRNSKAWFAVLTAAMFMSLSCVGPEWHNAAWAQVVRPLEPPVGAGLASLKTVPVPEPPNLATFVVDRAAAIRLGKALFWDMQLGSDGSTACATCHSNAGADNRTRNTLNPGQNRVAPGTLAPFPDNAFTAPWAPNMNLTRALFPLFKPVNPVDLTQGVASDNNDIVGSQGVVAMTFVDITPGSAVDQGTPAADPVFKIGTTNPINVRQVTARNAPSVINAAYNFTNFWDGRANNVFNGVNPFGPGDPDAQVFVTNAGALVPTFVRIRNASLASQALGPPLSSVEMSWAGRTWPKIGKKMLSLIPLGKQVVHPTDSTLGSLSRATATRTPGLNTTYAAMIQQAFHARYWANTTQIVTYDAVTAQPVISAHPGTPLTTSQFTQMEANFSLFFGLAIQLYESTLIANDSPFDRYMEGQLAALTPDQVAGLNFFIGVGRCTECHGTPELTVASVGHLLLNPLNPLAIPNPNANPLNAMELMPFVCGNAIYDIGFYNLGERKTTDDIGWGADFPFINPITGINYPLSFGELAILKRDGLLPTPPVSDLINFVPALPAGFLPTDTSPTPDRVVADGTFKTPGLRNVELTGPYFHNGGMVTLRQVVDFYTRGGNFPVDNTAELHPAIATIPALRATPGRRSQLVSFLLSLTDPAVKNEFAPFDHPELVIPNGATPTGGDLMVTVPEVGMFGRSAAGLPPLQPFMNVGQQTQ